MRRFAFAAMPLALLAFSAACGDGADKEAEPTTSADATTTPNVNEQPQVPDKQLPTPTPIPDTVPVIQVAYAGKVFAPTRTEFSALPKTKVSAGGKEYEGVALTALVEKAAAKSDGVVTLQGTRLDNLRFGAVRFPLADVAGGTVFVMDDSGHIALFSSSIPQEQWLKDITSVAFN